MSEQSWAQLTGRLRVMGRQRRIATFLLRLFRLNEVEVLPIGEYAVAYGYVALCNDLNDEHKRTLDRIRGRQSMFRLSFDEPRVTRAMLRAQAEEFERWLATDVS